MILDVFLAQVSTPDRILQTPIIGDVFYVFLTFTTAILVFTIIIAPVEYLAQVFLKKNIIFSKAYKSTTNSYQIHIWLCLLIAINALFLRYTLGDKEAMNFLFVGWLIGLIPGLTAYKKGRNFLNWWMYGHLLFIVAFPHALLLKETENSLINRGILKNCPYCAEVVKKEAKVCKHCGNQLN
ncbi:MAG: zinc ribbon domain-containing protein [Aphanizomenon sp.]|jgi:hypothetical protein